MKKILLGASAIALLFASSCKKKDDSGPANSWTVNSNTFGAATVIGLGPSLLAGTGTGTTTNTLQVYFNGSALPTSGGTYDVVAGSTPAANQISFKVSSSTGTTTESYSSTGAGGVKATISVSGGKVSVSMPTAEAKLDAGATTANVSININQTN